jgi:hypothetical protein
VVFLFFALVFIASVLYLPQHLIFIMNRAWFYVGGDSSQLVAGASKEALDLSLASTATAASAATVESLAREL